MGKEILNRRQNIYSEDIPPKIVDTSGFLTATDYATASKGGVVKVGTTGGLQVSSGTLKGKTLTDATAYEAAAADTVLTKGDVPYFGGGGEGVTVESLYTGSPFALDTTGQVLTGKLSDYELIVVVYSDQNGFGHRSIVIPVSVTTLGADVDHATIYQTIGYGGTQTIFFDSGESVDTIKSSETNASVKICNVVGIK